MNARKLAFEAIDKIITNKSFSNLAVNEFLNKFELSAEDRVLFTKLVYGTIERLITLDFYLEPYAGQRKQKTWVRALLCMSAYQLIYMRIPDYAVVNEAVELANVKDRHIGSFVNAVLRNLQRNPLRSLDDLDEIGCLSIKYSFPRWLVAYLLKDYDASVIEKILEEFLNVKETAIRINTLKGTKEEILAKLDEEQIEYKVAPIGKNALVVTGDIQKSQAFLNGEITIQDLSAQLVAETMNPAPGEVILDICSSPGGKTAHLAALLNNTGVIYACDVYLHKLKLMDTAFRRLGVTNVKTQLIDARNLKEHLEPESFDQILADVPCSGLGVLAHKADIKYNLQLNAIEEIKKLQQEILESTYAFVKKGGFFTYSTCTINKEENEEQIKAFLEKHPDFGAVEQKTILPFQYHCDGFFICKMRRK